MGDIDSSERGIGPGARATDAGAAVQKGLQPTVVPADPRSGPKYWPPEKGAHRVILKGYKFDFQPTGDGSNGTVEGRYFASGHNGTYSITRNEAGSFQMIVKIGTPKQPVEDMNAILSIAGSDAKVSGVIQGATADSSKTARVSGNGTNDNPFKVQFPGADLEWYPIR